MDISLHLVPGRYKLPTAPGGSLRKDSPGWEKAETKFTAISGLPVCVCVCVCVLCRLHICTCVFQCVVCAIKNLTKVLIMSLFCSRNVAPEHQTQHFALIWQCWLDVDYMHT